MLNMLNVIYNVLYIKKYSFKLKNIKIIIYKLRIILYEIDEFIVAKLVKNIIIHYILIKNYCLE